MYNTDSNHNAFIAYFIISWVVARHWWRREYSMWVDARHSLTQLMVFGQYRVPHELNQFRLLSSHLLLERYTQINLNIHQLNTQMLFNEISE